MPTGGFRCARRPHQRGPSTVRDDAGDRRRVRLQSAGSLVDASKNRGSTNGRPTRRSHSLPLQDNGLRTNGAVAGAVHLAAQLGRWLEAIGRTIRAIAGARPPPGWHGGTSSVALRLYLPANAMLSAFRRVTAGKARF